MAEKGKSKNAKFVDWIGGMLPSEAAQPASASVVAEPEPPKVVPKETRPTIDQVRGGGKSMEAAGDVDNYRKGGSVKSADWREKMLTGKKKTRIAAMSSGGKVKVRGAGKALRGHGKGTMR